MMQANKGRDTKPELALRRALHAMGLRYRVCARPVPEIRRKVDIVFGPSRVAVEVRGCFWHGCPEHCRPSSKNREFWSNKITANRARDRDTEMRLSEAGWLVIVVWEHEDVPKAADRVAAAVRSRRPVTVTARSSLAE
ncbi:very short patch repair endonuclease [Rhodococcus pyridinivorans]|uniref:very short patch repair endonuclease n=1 Tax=Rhodococcus pyridinivorans TaxID=103816 RepID=UPI00237820C4|nr:very short patch repair endonuclease [Rhodococcus pyridinivorans]